MDRQPKYRIYPSLLIAYQSLLDYEQVADEDWNKVSQSAHDRGEYLDRDIGDYKLTPDEMYLKLEADLIDSINRIDGRYGEAADKGTAFNEIVDCLIEHRKSLRGDCDIWSAFNESGVRVIRAKIHDFTFDFDIQLCKGVAEFFKGSLPQYYAESVIDTAYGDVMLYGYIDEWVGNNMYDIKTTSRYSWGKFERGWQRHIYPWCVVNSGMTTEVDSFTYYVVEWGSPARGCPLFAKGIYKETYTYDHADSGIKIREMLESFIGWLESRREFIQDKRIFCGVNPECFHGEPVDMAKLEKTIFHDNFTTV